jgi:hypothetical protein
MTRSALAFLSLFFVLLAGASLAPFAAAQAQGRIGVTQSTEGDPLGKPPGGTERILRVGMDVQANEAITTSANDRAHLIFLDGTTLTIGPNAQIMVDKFVYDPTTQKGELAVNATKGVMRVIGGRISKTSAITVNTPSSSIGIRGGIMIVGVEPTQTTAVFVFGDSMTVTAQGSTQSTSTPGFGISCTQGQVPSLPSIVVQGSLAAAMGALASNQQASAAVVAAINAVVASNLSNAAVLASLTAIIQQVIIQNAPQTIGTTQTNIQIIPIIENPNQTQSSPN